MNTDIHLKGMDTSQVRKVNIVAVLKALRTEGRMGRRDIAKLTNLSFPTICRVVNDLIEHSIISEVASINIGKAKRKTGLLDINPDGGWVVAMDIGASTIRAAAIDFCGKLCESTGLPLENIEGEKSVTPAILSVLTEIINKCEASRGKPQAIGISCPGIVDSHLGVVRHSYNLQLRDYPMARIVQQAYNVPVVIYNDVVSSTLAEAKLGPGQEHSNFAYVMVGTGIGAGFVFDGQVRELPPYAEFGLTVVAPEGDPERFGGRGYLESIASGRGIAAAVRREIEAGATSMLTDIIPGDASLIKTKDVAEAANQGDELARKVLASAASHLGLAIVNLAHTLGLTMFVISGGVSMSGDAFWKPLREAVEKYEYWPGRIRLESSILQKDAALLGVGILALDKTLEDIE